MVRLNDLDDFLKKEDLKEGDILTFLNAGAIRQVDFSKTKDNTDKKKVFQISVMLPNGQEKIATLNKTSRNALSAEYGIETEPWVGKHAKVNFVEQLAFGKLTQILILKPIV